MQASVKHLMHLSFHTQDLAQGKSLAELVKGGWRADEEEVTRIAKELLNILDYLSTRRPAVTHRSTFASTVLSFIAVSHGCLKRSSRDSNNSNIEQHLSPCSTLLYSLQQCAASELGIVDVAPDSPFTAAGM